MKFMKLGSKPDAFRPDADGNSIRYVTSELESDIVVKVGEVQFYLHKFPLLSKSNRLQKLVPKSKEDKVVEVCMDDFPGGANSFEICAKFCYGMTVTLNAYNVVAVRCAAEYMEMTEDVDRSNLIYKIEVFLNSSIFRSWKDTIIVLQTTGPLLSWAEDLKIVGRCIDSIASKTSVDPAIISWSYTHNRKLAEPDKITEEGTNYREKMENIPRDWWVEDICELDIDLYKRVMIAVKSKGRMDGSVIGEALKTYALRWLPDSVDALISDDHASRNKSLIETIICLLPSDKGVGCSCSFLLKLLKVSTSVGADEPLKEVLVNRIGLKLHESNVSDLLIPARSPQITFYDVELVLSIVNRFMIHEKSNWDQNVIRKNGKGTDNLILGHGSLVGVGRLIDGYLAEVAYDPNLNLVSFIELSQSLPELARPIHDGLYKAIDIYLKEHPSLTKAEKKGLCGLMDVKKLTMEASMDAAQNERLPLRVVVQVLFFEQVRSSAASRSLDNQQSDGSQSTANLDEECDKVAKENCKALGKSLREMKVSEELQKNGRLVKKNSKNSRSGAQLLPSRSRRIFDKLWSVGKGGHGENKSSETSGSSHSPTSIVPGDSKSVSSRHRRHSVS